LRGDDRPLEARSARLGGRERSHSVAVDPVAARTFLVFPWNTLHLTEVCRHGLCRLRRPRLQRQMPTAPYVKSDLSSISQIRPHTIHYASILCKTTAQPRRSAGLCSAPAPLSAAQSDTHAGQHAVTEE
jgi:hypothetical protein